jgi:integration host factor subunit alpha
MALTKNNIVEKLREQIDCTRQVAIETTESLIEIIKSSLESGDDVLVSNFGKFRVKEKAERKGRNPATGEDMMRPARRVVTFKCSARLRERINGK